MIFVTVRAIRHLFATIAAVMRTGACFVYAYACSADVTFMILVAVRAIRHLFATVATIVRTVACFVYAYACSADVTFMILVAVRAIRHLFATVATIVRTVACFVYAYACSADITFMIFVAIRAIRHLFAAVAAVMRTVACFVGAYIFAAEVTSMIFIVICARCMRLFFSAVRVSPAVITINTRSIGNQGIFIEFLFRILDIFMQTTDFHIECCRITQISNRYGSLSFFIGISADDGIAVNRVAEVIQNGQTGSIDRFAEMIERLIRNFSNADRSDVGKIRGLRCRNAIRACGNTTGNEAVILTVCRNFLNRIGRVIGIIEIVFGKCSGLITGNHTVIDITGSSVIGMFPKNFPFVICRINISRNRRFDHVIVFNYGFIRRSYDTADINIHIYGHIIGRKNLSGVIKFTCRGLTENARIVNRAMTNHASACRRACNTADITSKGSVCRTIILKVVSVTCNGRIYQMAIRNRSSVDMSDTANHKIAFTAVTQLQVIQSQIFNLTRIG